MHSKFKVQHKVSKYIKLMYNCLHDKKTNHRKVVKSLNTSHIYTSVYKTER